MDWPELKKIPKWSPLSELAPDCRPIARNLFEIDAGQYCLVTPYADHSLEVRPGGPFVSALLWSSCAGSALRAVAGEIEKDEPSALAPPAELLPAREAIGYRSILRALQNEGYKGISETASYRIATDGAFIHRAIDSEIATYYFRGLEENNDEPPYAILWKLARASQWR